jgi:glycosyltransferase involved in cell wall biosynthesis
VVSNLCLIDHDIRTPALRPALRRIGFLSNVQMEKGIDRFFDLIETLSAAHPIEGHIAGPFANAQTEAYVLARIKALPNVTCHGAVFGDRKRQFYDTIDAFIFPSRYPNEAEPLVLYEAMLAGLPVIATSRGCICDMVDPAMSALTDPDAADLSDALAQLEAWIASPDAFRHAQRQVAAHMRTLDQRRPSHRALLLGAFGLPAPALAQRDLDGAA